MSQRKSHRNGMPPDRGSDATDASGGWNSDPFADPIHLPTLRERAVIMLHRSALATSLVGREPNMARGAELVAAVTAVRMAVTPAGSEDAYAFKAHFLRGQLELVDPLRRDRLASLVEVALQAEADQRLLNGLGIAGLARCLGDVQAPIRSVPSEEPAVARRRHLTAWLLEANWTSARQTALLLVRHMGDVARRGLPTDDVRRSLADVGFALCLGSAASPEVAERRIMLLGILHDSQRECEPSRVVIAAGAVFERELWGMTVTDRA